MSYFLQSLLNQNNITISKNSTITNNGCDEDILELVEKYSQPDWCAVLCCGSGSKDLDKVYCLHVSIDRVKKSRLEVSVFSDSGDRSECMKSLEKILAMNSWIGENKYLVSVGLFSSTSVILNGFNKPIVTDFDASEEQKLHFQRQQMRHRSVIARPLNPDMQEHTNEVQINIPDQTCSNPIYLNSHRIEYGQKKSDKEVEEIVNRVAEFDQWVATNKPKFQLDFIIANAVVIKGFGALYTKLW